MLKKVRRFLKNNSPDWLNTEVNKDLLQNLTPYIKSSQPPTPQTTHESQHMNVLPSPFRRGAGGEVEQVKPSLNKSYLAKNTPLPTANYSLSTVKGTPHWRRIRQVFQALDNAPPGYTYNQLIEYVREATGVGCSRKLISKWKKQKLSQKFPDHDSGDRHTEERSAAISASSVIVELPSTVNCLQSTDSNSLMTVKVWSYLAAAGIAVSLVGCELMPLNNNRPTENIAIASVTAPITPLTPIPERRKNRLEPRTIKIELTLSNPTDLKVKPGDKISAGQVLSDRVSERNRLQARKKQLQLSLEKLNLPLTPIPQPKPIPEISPLPPISYAEEEAAIKLKQQKLTEANRAIALQQEKIKQLHILLENNAGGHGCLGAGENNSHSSSAPTLLCSPVTEGNGASKHKLILEHERANLTNLEAARESAQIQLEVAQSKLTTAKEQRAYIEYQRQLEQTRRAIAVEQQQQAIASQESERERLLAEREYSQAQIETQIQTLDYQIEQLSTVRAPYEGTIKKVKWTGQSDHNLTAVVTLSVNSNQLSVTSKSESVDGEKP